MGTLITGFVFGILFTICSAVMWGMRHGAEMQDKINDTNWPNSR